MVSDWLDEYLMEVLVFHSRNLELIRKLDHVLIDNYIILLKELSKKIMVDSPTVAEFAKILRDKLLYIDKPVISDPDSSPLA